MLAELFETRNIRHVLETGSGLYSTQLMLRQPGLKSLVSIENNPEWAVYQNDPRHTLELVAGPVANHLPALDGFDLVFIDDDPVDDRETTIRRVLRQRHPLVVVHDTDWPAYKTIVAKHNPKTFTNRKPWTSVIWPT